MKNSTSRAGKKYSPQQRGDTIRRTDKEIIDSAKIAELLDTAEICRLGLINNGYAYIVPVNCCYSGGALLFHSALKGRKIELLRENPKISFEIDFCRGLKTGADACNCTTIYESVMGKGTAEFIESAEEKAAALSIFMKKYRGEGFDVLPDKTAAVAVIKINIESITAKKSPAG